MTFTSNYTYALRNAFWVC